MKSVSVISFGLLLFASSIVSGQTASPKDPKDLQNCERQFYAGLDSRLEPKVLGALPNTKDRVVGFEIVNHWPLVAMPHELIGFRRDGVSELSVPSTIVGISVANASDLLIQTDRGIEKIGDTELKPDPTLTKSVHGRVYNSGNPIFVEARAKSDLIQFVARNRNGGSLLIATFKGTFRAASWNGRGLAAIVDDSLYVWAAGGKQIVRLLTDDGLRTARDLALVGPNQVVIALSASLVLVTQETITVISGMRADRCRFDDGLLFVLDHDERVIWVFRGLEKLGTIAGDRAHAVELIKQAPVKQGADSFQFREAARILGCDKARTLFLQQVKTGTH
jgi:hypothetical protein